MSILGIVLLVILVVILLGGVGGPYVGAPWTLGYGYHYGGIGVIGVLLIIVLILIVDGEGLMASMQNTLRCPRTILPSWKVTLPVISRLSLQWREGDRRPMKQEEQDHATGQERIEDGSRQEHKRIEGDR